MRRIDGIIQVEEVLEIIDQGTTCPARCRLKNGMHVVVKYMKNPFGQQVLINEWIGSNIADLIGLTIPEYGMCELSGEVIAASALEEINEDNAGIAFYTKDYSKTVPPNRAILSAVTKKETEKVILFDHIVNNCDRHEGNLLCDISKGATLYVIDNSHIIAKKTGAAVEIADEELTSETILSNIILDKNKEMYDLLSNTVGYSEERMKAEAFCIKETLTPEVIAEIKASVPRRWIDSVGNGNLDKMFEILNKRIACIVDICNMIIVERRK